VAEAQICALCGGPVQIQKSKKRPVITLQAGVFAAKEVRKQCRHNPRHPVMGSEALSRLVKPRQRYRYELIVDVGLARYLRGKQRAEIREELLQAHRIKLSDGSVSNLCERFLHYLEALHVSRVPQFRQLLQEEGYPLHLDATCERGKGGLMVGMNGWRRWVLMATRIPSENEGSIRPLVEETAALFGDPIATVHDLGDAMSKAVAPLRARGVPDFVCHYHFLGAVGEKLFDPPYRLLRNILRQSQVQRDLRDLLRELRHYRRSDAYAGRFGPGRIREDLLALVLWLLEGDGKKTLLYPFCLSHLEFFQRCQQALQKAQSWVPAPRTQAERRAIKHLSTRINRLHHDRRFSTAVTRLEIAWQAFCELRDVLQLTNAELPNGEARKHQMAIPALEVRRLQLIETATNAYQKELRERLANASTTSPAGVILKYFEDYGKRLFGHPTRRDVDGSVLAVVERTNNVAEHFFGQEKHKLRRRLGRAHLARDLEDQPAQAALAANLQYPDYVRLLCGSLENLSTAFAELDEDALKKADPISRSNRDTALFRRVRALLECPDTTATDDSEIGGPCTINTDATVV
jgi:hypothetical protein